MAFETYLTSYFLIRMNLKTRNPHPAPQKKLPSLLRVQRKPTRNTTITQMFVIIDLRRYRNQMFKALSRYGHVLWPRGLGLKLKSCIVKRARGTSLDEDTALPKKTCCSMSGLDEIHYWKTLTLMNGSKEFDVGIAEKSKASWDQPLSLVVP